MTNYKCYQCQIRFEDDNDPLEAELRCPACESTDIDSEGVASTLYELLTRLTRSTSG